MLRHLRQWWEVLLRQLGAFRVSSSHWLLLVYHASATCAIRWAVEDSHSEADDDPSPRSPWWGT